jgi:pyrroline-5-carboxylate reductase
LKLKNSTIGFVGAGNMANSLIRGLLAKGMHSSSLWACDIDELKLAQLQNECRINIGTMDQLAGSADVILLAVKPQVMAEACTALASSLGDRQAMIISIAAGITTDQLRRWLGDDTALVRCMPNTPSLIGKGASGLYANSNVSDEQRSIAETIMNAVGMSVWVNEENDIDTVTAVSGSGPAYFFLFMEAMQNSAKEMGLSDELARALVYQTAAGAAELAISSPDHLEELRRRVTSPGGTTEKAISEFESGKLRELVGRSLKAARDRSVELAQESKN